MAASIQGGDRASSKDARSPHSRVDSAKRYSSTAKRDAAKGRVRKWKRNRAKWGAARAESFPGARLVYLFEAGRARRFELGADVERVLRMVLSRHAVELLSWLFAAERGFSSPRGGLRIRHQDAARLLLCSDRRAADAMRELAAHGLVEARWHFRALDVDERHAIAAAERALSARKHQECTPCYVTTTKARAFCARRERRIARTHEGGSSFQPGQSQPELRSDSNGVPARGRPERAFASALLWKRQAEILRPRAKRAPARVVMRLPGGRIALGSPLTPGVGRLANARVAEQRVATPSRADRERWETLFDSDPVTALAELASNAWEVIAERERRAARAKSNADERKGGGAE
jgi:hypothetical protein